MPRGRRGHAHSTGSVVHETPWNQLSLAQKEKQLHKEEMELAAKKMAKEAADRKSQRRMILLMILVVIVVAITIVAIVVNL